MHMMECLTLCKVGAWREIDTQLTRLLKEKKDAPELFAITAHSALRRGMITQARWFIDKAQGKYPQHAALIVENICMDFFLGDYDAARQKLAPSLLKDALPGHPIHLIAWYLSCLYPDTIAPTPWENIPLAESLLSLPQLHKQYEQPTANAAMTWDVVEATSHFLNHNDKLMAMLAARFGELFFPGNADSFAALGLSNTMAGFYENADRNFHEAIFRNTRHRDRVNLHHFFVFCRQHRYEDAIAIGLNVEKAGNLHSTGHGLLMAMMLKAGRPLEEIETRLARLEPHLQARKEVNPLIEVVRRRIEMLRKTRHKTQVIEELQQVINREDCPAAYLYFYAELVSMTRPGEARHAASCAIMKDPLHPDAKRWQDEQQEKLHFEMAGLFIPQMQDGGAWPTTIHTQLLNILFATPNKKLASAWKNFTSEHSLYTLEAGAARLLPFIYKTLSKSLAKEEVTHAELLAGIWKKTYVENALRMKHVLATAQLLAKEQIEVVVLKGLANALPLYGDLGSRPMSDADILISPGQMAKAHTLLINHGWHTTDVPSKDRLRFAYGITYRHPEGGMLDVHWKPCENFSSDRYDPADLGIYEHVDYLGTTWNILNPTTSLLCTILHGVEWNHLSPVRWVVDALLTLDIHHEQIDWQEMYRLAEKYHCLPILAAGLSYLTRYRRPLTDELPDALHNAIAGSDVNTPLMRIRLRPRNVLASFEEALATLKYFQQRYDFGDNDHTFIIGGNQPDHIKQECKKRNIHWLPHPDQQQMMQMAGTGASNYNMIVIDANLSCTFHCLNVQLDPAAIHYVDNMLIAG